MKYWNITKTCIQFSFLTIAIAGCSGGGTVATRGTVKLDGKALAGATVTFLAQDEGGRDASGSTDASGVFRLTTFQPHDGAMPGKYKVIVQPPAALNEGGTGKTPDEAKEAALEGHVKSKEPAVVIAPRYSQPGQTPLTQVIPAKGEILLELQSK